MTAKHFATAEEMAEHQAERELQEALRVTALPPEEFAEWFSTVWGGMQRSALFDGLIHQGPPTARCFATMEEKNRFDEARELELALALADSRRVL
jgi:hypothetical protein